MGGCVGSHHDSSGSLNENSDGTGVALGRNQPLKKEKPKWKSDYPMTDGQLRSKRDEFWDTAPAFEGRKEIWDALKAAAHAFENNDHELAQAIIDGANITLPHVSTQCLNGSGPAYLSKRVSLYDPPRSLRSSDEALLTVPSASQVRLGGMRDRAFSVVAPRLWNALPIEVRKAPSLLSFRRKVKTWLWGQAFE
ncbi:ubiquitin domain-containing protein 2 isoform X2 [Anolis carolinensis]|uniref:ubiquitin domain-containing protein 2 isoform X2 n=1 Tax=Anolis carolinensis TaxID=28377 RepID=UPI002F2B6D61